ncbi:hypothetical protein FOZ63_011395, partial [Perkinsus olseni]
GSEEIPSLDGLSMRYVATQHGARADLRFKHEDGREFALDRCALQKLPSRTNDDETRRELSRKRYVVQKIASARTLLVGTFFRETMNHEFSNLGIQNNEGFLICPAGGGKSVTIKLRLQDGRFADGPLAITPGRYVKVEGPNYDYKELINMDIEVTGRDAGRQTANITFYHKEKGRFTVNNMALKYHIPYEVYGANHVNDEHAYVKVFKDCYATKRHFEVWPVLTATFFHVNMAFDQSLKELSEHSTMICVESKDTISFMYRT